MTIQHFSQQQISNFTKVKTSKLKMGKETVHYDPEFNIKSHKSIIYARQIPSSKRKKNSKLNTKRWTCEEQQKYMNFVKNNIQKFQDSQKWKTYALMAKQIKTRSCDQCKSHHIKIMLKHNKSISALIKNWQHRQNLQQHSIQNTVNVSSEKEEDLSIFVLNNQIQSKTTKKDTKIQLFMDAVSFNQENIFDVLQL